MKDITQIEFLDIEEKNDYKELINTVINKCFQEEKLEQTNLYISITLTILLFQ